MYSFNVRLSKHIYPLQMFYIGCGCFFLSVGCQMLDEKDRFFSHQFLQITLTEYGIFVAVSLIGKTNDREQGKA